MTPEVDLQRRPAVPTSDKILAFVWGMIFYRLLRALFSEHSRPNPA